MKRLRAILATTLLISSIPAIAIPQKIYAADTGKGKITIEALRDKISVEREAIIADSRKLYEAKKTGDKAKIERVKQETDRDIEKRKAAIKALYKEMGRGTANKINDGKKKRNKLL